MTDDRGRKTEDGAKRTGDIMITKSEYSGLAKSVAEWKMRYVERLLARGIEPRFATEIGNAAEVLMDIEPEDSADDEISTMAEDGD